MTHISNSSTKWSGIPTLLRGSVYIDSMRLDHSGSSRKSVAITGATGLLGANLCNRLLQKGHEVFGLIKDEYSTNFLSPKLNRIYGDISVRSDVEYFIKQSNPDYFVHLAAQTQAYDSLKYPYPTFFNNIIGTLNVLECLREFSLCKAILIASSDKAYGELKGISYTEEHELRGIYPYDASKSATDLIANSYGVTYQLPISITRACNIYGPGDYNKQRLIPGIVNSFKHGYQFVLRNNGDDLREYIHVDDVVDAYEKIMDYTARTKGTSAFNISSGDRRTTKEVFELVVSSIGEPVDFAISKLESREIRKQFMDSSLLSLKTGWRSESTMAAKLPSVVKWYLDNF